MSKFLTRETFFPAAIIAQYVFAALLYIPSGDWRKVVYFLGAAIVNSVVVW